MSDSFLCAVITVDGDKTGEPWGRSAVSRRSGARGPCVGQRVPAETLSTSGQLWLWFLVGKNGRLRRLSKAFFKLSGVVIYRLTSAK